MNRQQWREDFEQVEQRILLNLQKLKEHNEVLRQITRNAEGGRPPSIHGQAI
ncbi:MAG TPA: hypothetical protein VEB59_14960 [Gemmatimonadales bacterium]|nr:hypothetical protein [Gemmatimonadales bacterium]